MLAAVSQMPEFKKSSTSSSSSSSSQGTSPPSSCSGLRSVDQQIQEHQHQHQQQHQQQPQQQLRSSTTDDLVVDVMTTSNAAAAAARSWLPLHQQYPSTGYYYTSFHHQQQQQQQQEYYHCPFTASQWAELEHQALIFKYMMARAPVPAELLNPIRRSLLSAAAAAVNGPHNLLAGGFQPGLGFSPLDLEPGRCRRTDGKKWRCSRPVVPEQKYCERHVNRGRNRSKKAKEAAAAAAAAAAATNRTSQSNGSSSCIGNGSSTHGSMKLISQHQMTFNNSNEHQTTRYLDYARTVQTQRFTQQRIQDTGGACIAEADDESSAQLLLRRRAAGAASGGGSGVVRATQALAA